MVRILNHQFFICFGVLKGNVFNIGVLIDAGVNEKADGIVGQFKVLEIYKVIITAIYSVFMNKKDAFLMRSMNEGQSVAR
jgi:hypothetical protein